MMVNKFNIYTNTKGKFLKRLQWEQNLTEMVAIATCISAPIP